MRSVSVAVLMLLMACTAPPPAQEQTASDADPDPPPASEADPPTGEVDADEAVDDDPLTAWLAGAEEALGRPEVDAPTFFYLSMHPDARPAFRSCESSWLAEAGIRWEVRYRVEADPDASESAPWVGGSGPLADRSFPGARQVRLRLTDPQGELSAAIVPYVVEDGQVWWLADCPEPG